MPAGADILKDIVDVPFLCSASSGAAVIWDGLPTASTKIVGLDPALVNAPIGPHSAGTGGKAALRVKSSDTGFLQVGAWQKLDAHRKGMKIT
jgi:hypothetical protein